MSKILAMPILSTIALAFIACTTPSTMLVNRDGKTMRCATMGHGTLIAIGTAEQAHDRCVRDAGIVGFVPFPAVTLGFQGDTKTKPMRVVEVAGTNAQSAGLRVGDLILEVDSRPVESFFTIITVMNTKKAGDRVTVKVQRDQDVLPLTIVAAAR